MKWLLTYTLIAVIIFVKNKFLYYKCNYLINRLRDNKIYEYIIPINDILRKANIYSNESSIIETYSDRSGINSICNSLLFAKGIFNTRCIRSPMWLYYLVSKLLIFKPIKEHISNKLLSILLYLVEWFFLYLLGVYLDKADIADKLLSWIYEKLNLLIDILLKNF